MRINKYTTMKPYFSFLLVFAFLVMSAQEKDFCDEYIKKENLDFQKFKESEIKNQKKYIDLKEIIFNDIKKNKEIKTDNIFLCIVSDTYSNDYFPSGSDNDCKYNSTLYFDKREFLDSLFWNKETFNFVKKNFNKNIFPVVNYGFGIEISKKNFQDFFSNREYDFIRDFPTINLSLEKQDVFFIPKKFSSRNKLFLGGITKIVLVFSDYESVNNAEITITNNLSKQKTIKKKYQYINNHWKLIETKN